jgi:uncharacterized alpha-E superfamily protein
LSNLVARFASNVYWLGRYLERAESIARILDINETYARDKPDGPDWERILTLYGDREDYLKGHEEVTPQGVISYYVTDKNNPSSIAYAMTSARQNARSVRHLISTEMWKQLNVFFNLFAARTRRGVVFSSLSSLCGEIKEGCQTFEGVAEGTFFRGEAWCFYHLGKYLERADQTTRILEIGYEQLSHTDGDSIRSVHANVLLRSVSGYHAYRARYPTVLRARDIANFLLYDPQFPRAVQLCANMMNARLLDLDKLCHTKRTTVAEKARKELEFQLRTGLGGRFTPKQLLVFIDALQVALAEVSEAIRTTYFEHI